MRWLRFSKQYVNTGITPSSGYRIETVIRKSIDGQVQALFGCRQNAGTADNTSFNAFHIYDAGSAPSWISEEYFRMDYAKAGAVKFIVDKTFNASSKKIYEMVLGSTSSVNGQTESGGSFATNTRSIFIGTINNGGSADTRYGILDFGYFKIFNASNVLVFDGVPVKSGSTEYKATPAPSHCFYDKVTDSYFTNAGSNYIGYEDDEIEDTGVVKLNSMDYGFKMLSDGDNQYEIMNGKYKLFGADLTTKDSQFKTFEFTMTGYDSEPSISWPGYIENYEFYYGSGERKKLQTTIDTGLNPKTIQSVFYELDKSYSSSNFQARAHQYQTGGSGSYNSYINPSSKNAPGYMSANTSLLYFNQQNYVERGAILGSGGSATWNTLGSFNGGSLEQYYWNSPNIYFKFKNDGKIEVSTSIQYNWIQRAGPSNYRVRWYDWCWWQGLKLRITILSTPYIL